MKKLNEPKVLLQELEELIKSMDTEIDALRDIVYRYNLMYGDVIKRGSAYMPDKISPKIEVNANEYYCQLKESKDGGSNYQRIKAMIQELQ